MHFAKSFPSCMRNAFGAQGFRSHVEGGATPCPQSIRGPGKTLRAGIAFVTKFAVCEENAAIENFGAS